MTEVSETTATPTIRDFDDADVPAMTELLHAAYAELAAAGLNFTGSYQDEDVTRARAQAGRCWVAELDGALVGTLTMSSPPYGPLQAKTSEARRRGMVWLNQLAVSPTLRRAGLARRLWGTGRTWAEAEGAVAIGADTAIPATHLVEIYRGWGFTPRGTIHWDGKTYDSVVLVHELRTAAHEPTL